MAQIKVTVTDDEGKVIGNHDYDLATGLNTLTKMERAIEEVQEQMINELWRGKSKAAIKICEAVKGRNQIKQNELKGYLEKNKAYLIDYEKRRETARNNRKWANEKRK